MNDLNHKITKWAAYLIFGVTAIVFYSNAFRGIVLQEVHGRFVRGRPNPLHTGEDAISVGIQWLVAGMAFTVIIYMLKRFWDEE